MKRIDLNPDGTVDDLAISGDLMRLEQMDDGCYWGAVYVGEQRVAFFLRSKGRIRCEVVEDDVIDGGAG